MESLKGYNTLDIKMEAPDLNDELSYPYNGHEDLGLWSIENNRHYDK